MNLIMSNDAYWHNWRFICSDLNSKTESTQTNLTPQNVHAYFSIIPYVLHCIYWTPWTLLRHAFFVSFKIHSIVYISNTEEWKYYHLHLPKLHIEWANENEEIYLRVLHIFILNTIKFSRSVINHSNHPIQTVYMLPVLRFKACIM